LHISWMLPLNIICNFRNINVYVDLAAEHVETCITPAKFEE
jgi:hypothetical protein